MRSHSRSRPPRRPRPGRFSLLALLLAVSAFSTSAGDSPSDQVITTLDLPAPSELDAELVELPDTALPPLAPADASRLAGAPLPAPERRELRPPRSPARPLPPRALPAPAPAPQVSPLPAPPPAPPRTTSATPPAPPPPPPSPSPEPPPPEPRTSSPEPSPREVQRSTGSPEERGRAALELLQLDPGRLGYTISFHEGRSGFLGLTDPNEKTIDIYVRDSQPDAFLRHVIAHEYAHALDFTRLDEKEQRRYLQLRGVDPDHPWTPRSYGEDQYRYGAEDFAEAFANYVAPYEWESRVAPPPTPDQYEAIISAGYFSP